MRICRSKEAEEEIRRIAALDRDVGEALSACIEMLAIDANEFEGQDGFSIRRIGEAFRRGIRIHRVKLREVHSGFADSLLLDSGEELCLRDRRSFAE